MYFAFLGGPEILLLCVVLVILFGATRLPQLGEALGKGIHNFRKSVSGKDEKEPPVLPSGQDKEDLGPPPAPKNTP